MASHKWPKHNLSFPIQAAFKRQKTEPQFNRLEVEAEVEAQNDTLRELILPSEIWVTIAQYLNMRFRVRLGQVNHQLYQVVWGSLDSVNFTQKHSPSRIREAFRYLHSHCPSLRKIFLQTGAVTDLEIVELPRSLKELSIWRARKITPEAFGSFPYSLRYLNLYQFEMSDEFAIAIPRFLEHLSFPMSTIQTHQLKFLPRALKSLDLHGCDSINETGFEDLPPQLEHLDVSCWLYGKGPRITGTGFINLPRSLRKLNLRYHEITDEYLKFLPPQLDTVDLYGCFNVTSTGLSSLGKNVLINLNDKNRHFDYVF